MPHRRFFFYAVKELLMLITFPLYYMDIADFLK